jgi:hypothetical protein
MWEEWLSSLSASLLVLGLGLILIVACLNFRDARKAGFPIRIPKFWPLRASRASEEEASEQDQEAWSGSPEDTDTSPAQRDGRHPEGDSYEEPESPATEAGPLTELAAEPLDPRYEIILQFSGDAPLAPVVGQTLQQFTHVQTKPVRAYVEPHKGVVQVGMVLATRSGFVSLMEIEGFLDQSEKLLSPYGLKRLGARPDSAALLGQARQVDQLLTGLDGQICFHLKASRMPSWPDVDRVMEGLGLVVKGEGHYCRQGSNGRLWYTISPADQGLFLSLLLDLPRVATPAAVLGRMVEEAQVIGQAFEADLVDDRAMALSAPAIAMMQSQVIARADQLQAAGLVPGATLTCRLFS